MLLFACTNTFLGSFYFEKFWTHDTTHTTLVSPIFSAPRTLAHTLLSAPTPPHLLDSCSSVGHPLCLLPGSGSSSYSSVFVPVLWWAAAYSFASLPSSDFLLSLSLFVLYVLSLSLFLGVLHLYPSSPGYTRWSHVFFLSLVRVLFNLWIFFFIWKVRQATPTPLGGWIRERCGPNTWYIVSKRL